MVLPDLTTLEENIRQAFGTQIADFVPAKLGNPLDGKVLVTDSDKAGLIYIHLPSDIIDTAFTATHKLNKSDLIYGRPVLAKREQNSWVVDSVDPDYDGQFMAGFSPSSQFPVYIENLLFGTITPTQPVSLRCLVKGAPYRIGNETYELSDTFTADFTSTVQDTASANITNPTANNTGKLVLVQRNAITGTVTYKQSGEFDNSLSHAQAVQYLRSVTSWVIPDDNNFVCGYIRLFKNIPAFDRNAVIGHPDLLSSGGMGSSSSDTGIQRWQVNTSTAISSGEQIVYGNKVEVVSGGSISTSTDGFFVVVGSDDVGSGGGASDASVVTFTPSVLADWDSDSDPGNVDDALDELAERVDDIENAGGSGSDASVITYTPTVLTDWDSNADPGNTDDALDQLAERMDDLEIATVDAGVVTYTPSVLTDWDSDSDPGNADDALDQLAERVDDLELATTDASAVTFTPDVLTDWDGDVDPGDLDDALNQLAERTDDLENATVDATDVVYLPADNTDWNSSSDPGNTDDALDQLADRLKTVEGAGGGGAGLFASYAILAEEHVSGTNVTSSSITWNARSINTEISDVDGIVTLSSGKFTPQSGDYFIDVLAIAKGTNVSRLRLYNVTGTSVVDYGISFDALSSSQHAIMGTLQTRFTANGTDEYRIDQYSQSTNAAGLGLNNGISGVPEQYCVIGLYQEA